MNKKTFWILFIISLIPSFGIFIVMLAGAYMTQKRMPRGQKWRVAARFYISCVLWMFLLYGLVIICGVNIVGLTNNPMVFFLIIYFIANVCLGLLCLRTLKKHLNRIENTIESNKI